MTQTHLNSSKELEYDPSKIEAYLKINPETKNSILYSVCNAITDSQKGYIRKAKSRILNNIESLNESSESSNKNIAPNNDNDSNNDNEELADTYWHFKTDYEALVACITDQNALIVKYNGLKDEYDELEDEMITEGYFSFHLKKHLEESGIWKSTVDEVVEKIRILTGELNYSYPY